MLKVNELRIDNVLWDKEREMMVVISSISSCGDIGINDTCEARISVENFDPIPLTEEWLKRSGFERFFKSKNGHSGYSHGDEHYFEMLHYYNTGEWRLSVEQQSVGIAQHYVHQLQNLYFALTGQELTIK